jgi:hypothetical protein
MEIEDESKLYGCAVTRMRKTKRIREALKLKGLTDEQIKYAKVWRFSNRVYTEEQLEDFKSQSQLPKDDRDYESLFQERGISESSMKYYAPNYTARLMCDNKIDAVLAKEAEVHRLLGKQSGSVTIQKLERNHSVYAFRLSEDIVGERKFREANPNLEQLDNLVYIGMTSKRREERFIQHINAPENGRDLGAKFMREYGVKSFSEADATEELFRNRQYPHEKLTFGEALNTERYYGENLKSKSCGTWWN